MTQPPQPGGYGAPHTPPRPPRPPVPPPPAGPYSRLQDPYDWNTGYGAPQPSPPPPLHTPPPAGPGGGGRRPKGWSAVVVAALVAVALIIGGGVLYANSGDGGAKDAKAGADGGTGGQVDGGGGTTSQGSEKVPARTASRVLFQIPSPKAVNAGSGGVPGSWLTGKAYVKTGVAEIVGYDPDRGTELWTIPLPGPVCTVTGHTTEDDLTAIVHEPAMPTKAKPTHGCTQVSAIDLDAGRKLWTGSALRGTAPIRFDNITISGRTVAAGGAGGGAAFDITSGTSLWTPKAKDTCHDAGYGGGPKLVVLRKCRSQDGLQLHIQTVDPQSGRVISAYRMADGIEQVAIVSTDPLVVAANVADGAGDGSGVTDYFSLDNRTGRLRTRISAPGEQYAAVCDVISRIERCSQVAVGKDRLYLPTKARAGGAGSGQTNEIVAFDLTTGRRTAQRAAAGDGYVMAPLRMDGGDLLAYKRSSNPAQGGQVVSIDGATFQQTRLLANPATQAVRGAEAALLPERAEYLYAQGRLYISATSAAGPGRPGERRYLVLAFGAGD